MACCRKAAHGRARADRPTPSRILTYGVPLVGDRPSDRMRGDVRGERIALLLFAGTKAYSTDTQNLPGEIVLAALPGAKEVPR